MKLSRTIEYALQAILQLAQAKPATPVPCSQLAMVGSMPERFLLQVLRSLVTQGILSSTRGVVGGYTLARRPEEISLLDVIEAIEGPLVAGLSPTHALPDLAAQRIRAALEDATVAKRAELSKLKLSQLLPTAGEGHGPTTTSSTSNH